MLQLVSLSKRFGTKPLFKGVTLAVSPKQKIGLLGPPGCGKTTLLRIILGLEGYGEGRVSVRPLTWFGYLSQLPMEVGHYTVGDILKAAQEDFYAVRAGLEVWAADGPVREGMSPEEGDGLEQTWQSILAGLGLRHLSPNQRMAALRPGEQRRIWLASLLLARPDCLVLDEPTYHLDDSATRWLSTQLQSYPGTVLLVSHDQILLENVADTIWEVVPSRYTVQEYAANYSAYLAARGKSPTQTSPLTSERYPKISTRR